MLSEKLIVQPYQGAGYLSHCTRYVKILTPSYKIASVEYFHGLPYYSANPTVTPAERIVFYESKDSVNTPNYYTKDSSVPCIRYRPKFNLDQYLRKPKRPVFNPPKFKPIRKPVLKLDKVPFEMPINLGYLSQDASDQIIRRQAKRYFRQQTVRNGRRIVAHNKLMRWYKDIMLKRTQRIDEYKRAFARREAKFARRMSIYEKRLKISENWRHRLKRGRRTMQRYKDPHPYSRIRIWGKDLTLVHFTQFPYWDGVSLVVPWVYSCPSVTTTLLRDSALFGSQFEEELSAIETSLQAQCTRKVLEKLGNKQIHLANLLAERAQTLGMFMSSVKRLTEFLKSKKTLFHSVAKYFTSPKKLANDFLAFKFGVEPLVKDVQSLARLLAENANGNIVDNIVTRSKRTQVINHRFKNGDLFVNVEGEICCSLVVRHFVDNDWLRSLNQFGLVNPLEVAWEVLPWSFVVDWFLPVSSFLEKATSTVGLDLDHTTLTFTRRLRITTSSISTDVNPHGHCYDKVITAESMLYLQRVALLGEAVYESKKRTLINLEQASDLYTKNPYSLTHNLEALALLVQRLH